MSTAIAPKVRLMAGALGAQIYGIDLNTLTDDGFRLIHDLLLKHQVVFIAGQADLTPAAHIAFGRRFGEVELHPYLPRLDGHPEIVIIDSEQGGKTDVWHTDMTFHQSPPVASILHLVQVPPSGGDTMFTNQCLVYEQLSPPIREFLDGLTAIHVIRIGAARRGQIVEVLHAGCHVVRHPQRHRRPYGERRREIGKRFESRARVIGRGLDRHPRSLPGNA